MEKKIIIFRERLKELQRKFKIPGLSFMIIQKNKIVHKEGLGFADIDNKIKAKSNTQYRIASLTKPISASIILKLVELGKLNLEDPISVLYPEYKKKFQEYKNRFERKNLTEILENYNFEREDITIKHHLSHTSKGIPGDNYSYSGFLFGELTKVIDNVSKEGFESLMKNEIINKLKMDSTITCKENEEYEKEPDRLAVPYFTDEKGKVKRSKYPLFDLNTAAGIISTVEDLSKFDIALNKNQIISEKSKELAFTPMISKSGKTLPYGLGWFIQNPTNPSQKILWHYGLCDNSISSLYVKIPSSKLTLIILANTDALCNFPGFADNEDVSITPFAKIFIDIFMKEE
ncbi:MAG: serine hydrolase domain-containing protein [Candidatus Thorarchaeota archaeon]